MGCILVSFGLFFSLCVNTLMSSLTKRNQLEQADFNGFIVSPSIFWNTTSTQVCMICHRNDGRSVWLEGVTTTSLKGREPTSSRPGSARAHLKQKWCSQSFSRSWCLEAFAIKTILKAQNYLKRTAIWILFWVLKPMKIARDEFVSAFRCCLCFQLWGVYILVLGKCSMKINKYVEGKWNENEQVREDP